MKQLKKQFNFLYYVDLKENPLESGVLLPNNPKIINSERGRGRDMEIDKN